MGKCDVVTFSDGEISVSIQESVRGSDVFVVQSTCHAGQRQPDGTADHDRRLQAGIRRPDHRGDPLLRLCPPGPQGQGPRPDLRQAGGRPDHHRRCGPGADHGPARRPDPGLFRHPGGPSAGRADPGSLFYRAVSKTAKRIWWWFPPTWAPSPGPGTLPSGWMRRWPSWTSAARRPTSARS